MNIVLQVDKYSRECDSTLYAGMTQKQNGKPIPPIHYSFAKYHLWKGIKPKRAFRSHFRLIRAVTKLLTSEKNVDEVANWRKIIKIKDQISGLFLNSSSLLIFQQSYQSIYWSYEANFNTSNHNFFSPECPFLLFN